MSTARRRDAAMLKGLLANMILSTRLTIAMVMLAVAAIAAVGFLTQRNLSRAFVPEEIARIDADARRLAANLEAYVQRGAKDVLALRNMPAVDEIVARYEGDAPTGTPLATLRHRLARVFEAELRAKPEYLQVQLIGLADDGAEIVRSERSPRNGRIRTVPNEMLQQEGGIDYFDASVGQPEGSVLVSPVRLDRELGVVERPYVPVIRTATPIATPAGGPFGILVINVDLRNAFARLRRAEVSGAEVYLLNARGDYLVHPDPARAFGFEFGAAASAFDDFPDLARLVGDGEKRAGTIHDREGRRLGAAAVPVSLAGGRDATILLTLPYEAMLTGAEAIEQSILVVGFLAILGACGLAAVLARYIAAPLTRMARAIEGFDGEGALALPVEAGGETGTLARAFARHVERERLFNAAVGSSNCAILTRGLDGRITSWNRGAEKLFGYPEDEVLGLKSDIVLPEERRAEFDRIADEAHCNRFPGTVETIRKTRSGALVDVALTVSPMRDVAGKLVGVSVFAIDISERKEAERAMRIAKQTAERVSLMKSQFLANMSHELRTPLNSIIGFSDMMLMKVAGPLRPDRYHDYVESISAAGRHLLALVDDLLDLSRAESGNLPLSESEFDLVLLVEEVGALMAPLAAPREIDFVCSCPLSPVPVTADQRKIRQVLINLVSNALKFTPEGGRVLLALRRTGGGEVRVVVEDTGIGIPQEDLARVFAAYAQVDDAYNARDGSGAGLGLALCKRLVELHGGRIWLNSRINVGTTVTVLLPAFRVASAAGEEGAKGVGLTG